MSDRPLVLSYQFQHTPLAGYTPVKADVNVKTGAPQAEAPAPAPKSAVAAAPGDAVVIAKRKPNFLLEGAKRAAAGIGEFVAAVTPGAAIFATGVAISLPSMTGDYTMIPWVVGGIIGGAVAAFGAGVWQLTNARNSFDKPDSLMAGLKAMGASLGFITIPAAIAGIAGVRAWGGGWGLLAASVVAGATWWFGESVLQVNREQNHT